jgi:hypothetical protein
MRRKRRRNGREGRYEEVGEKEKNNKWGEDGREEAEMGEKIRRNGEGREEEVGAKDGKNRGGEE